MLVPFFSGKEKAQIQEEGWALVLLLAVVFAVLALALIVTAPYWMPLVVIGFSNEAKELAVSLARIQIAGMVFSGAVSVLLSACHAQGKFMVAEAVPCISTALAFGLLVHVLPRYGVTGAAWVNVLRAFAGVALMLPFLGRPARLAFGEVGVVWSRLRPLLLSASYYKSDQLFDRFLSSMGSVGGLSLFYFAQQACVAANTVLGKAIAAPVVPRLATLAKAGDWPTFYQVYRRRLFLITGVSALACLTAALSASVVLHHLALVPALRQLTGAELAGLARLFVLLSGVIVGGGAGLILSEAFFAKGQTRTPAAAMAVCFTGSILAKALGFSVSGVDGLALATSVYFMSYPLLLYLLIESQLARDLKVCRP